MIKPLRVRNFLILCAAVAPLLRPAPAAARPVSRGLADGAQAASSAQGANAAAHPAPTSLNVTVTDDKGRFITGLKPADFTVFDGGRQADIAAFQAGDAPATVGIVVDGSASMFGIKEAYTGALRNPLLGFLRGCNPSDEFFLMAFNKSPQLLLERSNDPAAVLSALDRFAAAPAKGQTAMYDALYLAVNQASRGQRRKRVLLLISDGMDNVSRYSFDELRRQLKESDVTLYAIGIVEASDNSELSYGARSILNELASVSGGRAYYPRIREEMSDSLDRVAIELRAQYTIGFTPAPTARKDGWHDVSIKLRELRDAQGRKIKTVVRARPGFYDVADARR
jgi:Ca-activated chloride channel family protein